MCSSKNLLRAAALLLPALLCASAEAHFVWLVRTIESGEPRLELYFGEAPEPGEGVMLDLVEDARVHRVTADGLVPVTLERGKHALLGSLKDAPADAFFVLQRDFGVMTRGDEAFLLRYYAKTGPALSDAAWRRGSLPSMTLDIVPERQDDALLIHVTWRGKPVAGAEVKAMGPGLEGAEAVTNELGQVKLPISGPGRYAIRARHVEDQGGETDGEEYTTTRHYTTLTVDVDDRPEAAPKIHALPNVPKAVTSFGAAVSESHLYMYGGHTGNPHEYGKESQAKTLWRLDMAAEPPTWSAVLDGPGLQGLALLAREGKLYRLGGFTAQNKDGDEHDLWSVSDAVMFDPKSPGWQPLPDLPEPRSSFDAAVMGDTIYVVGGWTMRGKDQEAIWLDTAWAMDLSAEEASWKALPEVPFRRRALSVAAFEGKIWAIGGMQAKGGPTTRVDVFDPKTGAWAQGPSIVGEGMTGFGSSSFATGGRLYVTTYDGNLQRLAEDGQSWEVVRELKRARFFHRMLPLSDHALVSLGGGDMMVGKFEEVDVIDVK
ncbi:MAG: hypothetical protein RL885_33365 [Planctomycetota bacterium]